MSIQTWMASPDGLLYITKDPDASLRYGIDVAGILATGDAISSATIASQSGVTATQVAYTGTVVHCRVAGGTVGTDGVVTLQWTTTDGDTDQRTMVFKIAQR